MKTFFLSLIAVIGLSTVSFAQDGSNSATAQSKTQLVSAKESGMYTFVMPSTNSRRCNEKFKILCALFHN